jgi:hypothetical protein
MPVLLTDNIACELGLSNGTQGIFRELIYDDQEEPGSFKVKSEVFPLKYDIHTKTIICARGN